MIDQDLAPGNYSLVVASTGGAGTYALTATMAESTAPFQPVSGETGYIAAMVTGDFNGDGHLDLALADAYGVSVLLGNGDGTFQPPILYDIRDFQAIVAGDFNGDGHLDLALAGEEYDYATQTEVGEVSVLLGNGDGTFQTPVTYADGGISSPNAIVAGDFTGNGRLDLAVTCAEFGHDFRLAGHGDGTFQSPILDPVGFIQCIVAGDFNGDGRTDLAVASDGLVGEVSVLLANADGTFQPPINYQVPQAPDAMVAADLTGNGRLDLPSPAMGTTRIGVAGQRRWHVQPAVTYAADNGSIGYNGGQRLVTGDFTGNGHIDLAVANGDEDDLTLLLGTGNGTFQPAITYAVASTPVGRSPATSPAMDI